MDIKVGLSDGREFTHSVQYKNRDKYYEISCVDAYGEEMGFVNFSIDKSNSFRQLWLYKIKTQDEFLHQGVGSALISALEYFAYRNGIRGIEGKYYPDNEFAEPFYDKHGYSIYSEYYCTMVGKYLDFEKFKQETLPQIDEAGFTILDIKENDGMGA